VGNLTPQAENDSDLF